MTNLSTQYTAVMKFLKDNDDFSIFYHLDCDGITSAALLTEAINRLGKRVYAYRPTNYEDFKPHLDLSDFSKNIIICDVAGTVVGRNISLFSGKNLCVLDHHELAEPECDVYVNPKMWGDDVYTPCALLTYRLLKGLVKDLDWVSLIGTLSDAGGKENKDFVFDVCKKYGVEPGSHEFLLDNIFGRAGELINNMVIEYERHGADEALGILLLSKSLKELMDNERLRSTTEKIDKNIKSLIVEFATKSEKRDNLIYFFEMDPEKRRYASTLSTVLSMHGYGDRVIVIMTKVKNSVEKISIRASNVGIDLPDILKHVFKHMKGSGGGHKPAAGAQIEPNDKEKFKKLFVEETMVRLEKPL